MIQFCYFYSICEQISTQMKTKKKTTTEVICQNLGLPNQTIFQDYKCTLKVGFPFFGRLYIGQEHLMFVSNMFGIVKKAAIIIDTITKVTELSNDTISVSGRQFKSPKKQEEEFIFTGFKNNNAYRIIYALWRKQKLSSDVLNSHNQEESQAGEKIGEVRGLDEGSMQISFFNPEIVDTEKQKMVELVLPCSLQQFYTFFLADDAAVYPRSKHLEFKKATNIVVTPWKKNEELGAEIREVNALLKVKGVPFKSEAGMNQVWLLKRSPEEISIKTTTQMSDVPFSSYFTCEEHIKIEKEGETKCKFNCCSAIVFNKSTYMKNTILTRTFADLKQDYIQWTDNVKEQLEKMKKSQEDNEKKKNRQMVNVQFESQKIISPTRNERRRRQSDQSISEGLQKKIDILARKVTQLLIVVLVLSFLVLGNIFVTLYTTKSPLSQTTHSNSDL